MPSETGKVRQGLVRVIAGIEEMRRELWIKPGSGEAFRDIEEAWCPELVVLPAGRFRMGSTDAEIEALTKDWGEYFKDEAPQHEVTIPVALPSGNMP